MDKKYPNPPVRWWCGGYCAPTESTVYGAAFGAYPIGTCSAWGWILTAIMAHFIAFSASLWWEIYFLRIKRILFWRETSVQKGLFGSIRWYVREIYTLRLCYGLLDDCFEVGGWVSFMPILTDSEMSIRVVSAVPWFVDRAGPAEIRIFFQPSQEIVIKKMRENSEHVGGLPVEGILKFNHFQMYDEITRDWMIQELNK